MSSSNVKMVASIGTDMLLNITSTGDELFTFLGLSTSMTLNDLEP